MVDETRLIEMLEEGASLAVCAAEFGVSRNAIHKRKQKLIASGKLKADEGAEPEESGLSELEQKAADALDEFRAANEAHEHARNRLKYIPGEIEDAKRDLAEVAAGFYLGEMSEGELTMAEMELEDLERELRTIELALPVLRKRKDTLRELSENASRTASSAANVKPYEELKACFMERGTPLNSGEEQELRRLGGTEKRYEVDSVVRKLEDMTGRRMLQTGHAQPKTSHWTT